MIFVTGGTGLIGSHLLYLLCKTETTRIKAIYRDESKIKNVKKVFEHYDSVAGSELFKKIDWAVCDILNLPELKEEMTGTEYVYHCAALVSFRKKDFRKLIQINRIGTANIVNLSLDYKVDKLCHVSSIATLSSSPNEEQIDERITISEHDKNNAYAIAKYGAEREAWRGSQEGLNVVIVNPGVILGHGGFQGGSSKIIDTYSRGFPFYLEKITGFIGVEDCIVIMFQLMQSDAKNERYVLVSENLSFKDLAIRIAHEFKAKPPRFKLTKLHLSLVWLGSLIMQILGRKRAMTRDLITSLFKDHSYNHQKIKSTLDYEFSPINEVIKATKAKHTL